MKAAILYAPGEMDIADAPDPEPTPGQVVLRVEASSICGSDLAAYRGVSTRVTFPTVLGHEIAGTIVAVGDEAHQDLLNTRVVVEPNVSCGACEWCRAGLPNVCPNYRILGESMALPGGLAEYVAVHTDQVQAVPENLSAAEAAIIQPLSIAYHGVVDRARVEGGETVLIIGAGPIGLAALLIAVDAGARCIVADVVDDRLATARQLGAAVTVRADIDDLGTVTRGSTDGRGADVVIEAVGGTQDRSLSDAVAAVATRGRITILGNFAKEPQTFPTFPFKNRELTIIGSHGHPETFGPTLELVRSGRVRPADLITHKVPLSDVADAFRMLDGHVTGVVKVVLVP